MARPNSRSTDRRPRSRERQRGRKQKGRSLSREERQKARERRNFNKNISNLADRICSYVGRSQPIWIRVESNDGGGSQDIVVGDYLRLDEENNTEENNTIPGYVPARSRSPLRGDYALSSPICQNDDAFRSLELDLSIPSHQPPQTAQIHSTRQQTQTPPGPNKRNGAFAVSSTGTGTGTGTGMEVIGSVALQTKGDSSYSTTQHKNVPLCTICQKELDDTHAKVIGLFSVPVCSECSPPTPVSTPRGLKTAPVVYASPKEISMSGVEVELVVRAWGVGNTEGLRFEAHDSLSANRCYVLETTDAQCLRIIHANRTASESKLPKTGRRAAEVMGSLEKYYERLTSVLRLVPNPNDRRGKILDFKGTRIARLHRRKSQSKSPTPIPHEHLLGAGENVASLASAASAASLREERVSRILAEEEKSRSEIADNYGPVHCYIPEIKLGGIMCAIKIRCNRPLRASSNQEVLAGSKTSEQEQEQIDGVRMHAGGPGKSIGEEDAANLVLYIQATDEQFGEYSLKTTFAQARSLLAQRGQLSAAQGRDFELAVVLPRIANRLVWLEGKNSVERRIKHLTLNRPMPSLSRMPRGLRKTRSLSPVRERGHDIRTPVKKEVPRPRRASVSRVEQAGRRASIALELKAEEESKHEQHTANYGPVQYQQHNVKLSGITCHVDVRFKPEATAGGTDEVCFHVVDDQLKDYFLNASFAQCTQYLRKRGVIGEGEACDAATATPSLVVKHLLWLEYVNANERRVKKLTLGRPIRAPRMIDRRKSRSMSPIRTLRNSAASESIESAGSAEPGQSAQSLAETRKRLLEQASVAALTKDNKVRRALAEQYGPIVFEKGMRLANIPFQVAVRYDKEAGNGEMLFQAVDDYLTDYTFPCTIKGCLTTLAVRGIPVSEELVEDELIRLCVEKLLWFENVDETERRKKRLTLNRPIRSGSRIPMKRKKSTRELEIPSQ